MANRYLVRNVESDNPASNGFGAFIERAASRTGRLMESVLNQVNGARFRYIPKLKMTVIAHEIGHAMATHPGGTIVTHCVTPGEAGLCYGETIFPGDLNVTDHESTVAHPGCKYGVSIQDADLVIRLLAGPIMEDIHARANNSIESSNFNEFMKNRLLLAGKKPNGDKQVFYDFLDHVKNNGGGTDLKMIEDICSRIDLSTVSSERFIYEAMEFIFHKFSEYGVQRASAIAQVAMRENLSFFFVGDTAHAANDIIEHVKSIEVSISNKDTVNRTSPHYEPSISKEDVDMLTESMMCSMPAITMIRCLMSDTHRTPEAADLLRRETRAWARLIGIPLFSAPIDSNSPQTPAKHLRLRALQFSRITAFMALQDVINQHIETFNDANVATSSNRLPGHFIALNQMAELVNSVLESTVNTPLWDDFKLHMKRAVNLEKTVQEILSNDIGRINGSPCKKDDDSDNEASNTFFGPY